MTNPAASTAPLHNNSDVPPVDGMVFLGTHEGTDVYFVPDPEGGHFPAITIVEGDEDWQWDSCLVRNARSGRNQYSEGSAWHFGLVESEARGLLPHQQRAGGPVGTTTA